MRGSALICLTVLVTLGLVDLAFGVDAAKWNYLRDDDHYGPSAWDANFAECSGSKNSPIDIVTNDAIKRTVEPWEFTNWDSASDWTIIDTNYTVVYNLEGGSIQTNGGSLGNAFELLQFHFHWGSTDRVGSEHTYNGKRFPLEVHFVHRNTEFITTDDAVASGNDDSLAVLGFFFTLQAEDNPQLASIVEGVRQLRADDDSTVEGYSLSPNPFLTTAKQGNFYRYYGGLTTPGCQQIVKWTVFETPIGISAAQMDVFRNRSDSSYGTNFYRDVQPIGSRLVTLYDIDCTVTTCGAPAALAPISVIILFSAISKYL